MPYKNGSVVDVHRIIFRNSNMIDTFTDNIFESVFLSKVLYFKEKKLFLILDLYTKAK